MLRFFISMAGSFMKKLESAHFKVRGLKIRVTTVSDMFDFLECLENC